MLYALTLAGFVFLFVTAWHLVFGNFFKEVIFERLFERLTLPINEIEPKHSILWMDLSVALIFSGIFNFWLYYRGDFSSNVVYAILATSILLLTFSLWRVVVDKISSSKRVRSWRGKNWLWKYKDGSFLLNFKDISCRATEDFLVGMLIAVLFMTWLHKYPFLAEPEDASMDFAMTLNQCLKGSDCAFGERLPHKIALLDIDDETYQKEEWGGGKPPLTPRDKLKELIERAVEDGAALIVLDISLSEKTPAKQVDDSKNNPDNILRDYLAKYENDHCGNKKCPPIILVRDFLPAAKKTNIYQLPVRQVRESFLDESIKLSPHVQWASPTYWKSLFDGKVRRFWLWQPICDTLGNQKFIPSVELLVAGLVSNEGLGYGGALGEIKKSGQSLVDPDSVKKECSNSYYEPKSQSGYGQIVLGDLKIEKNEISGGGISQRIMFIQAWPLDNVSSHQKEQKERKEQQEQISQITYGDEKEILLIFSAYRYLNPSPTFKYERTYLKDRIVIIGNSHSDAGYDMHETPLGNMPGMLVIANAIYSLFLNHGQIRPLGWEKIAVETMLGLAMIGRFFLVFFAVVFGNVSAALLSSLFSVFVRRRDDKHGEWMRWRIKVVITIVLYSVVGVGIWLILINQSAHLLSKEGIWIDFSLPLVTMFFHHVIVKFHELRQEVTSLERELEERERQWQDCQSGLRVHKEELSKCKQDKQQCEQDKQQLQQLLSDLEKSGVPINK